MADFVRHEEFQDALTRIHTKIDKVIEDKQSDFKDLMGLVRGIDQTIHEDSKLLIEVSTNQKNQNEIIKNVKESDDRQDICIQALKQKVPAIDELIYYKRWLILTIIASLLGAVGSLLMFILQIR